MKALHQILRLKLVRRQQLRAQLTIPGDRSLYDMRKERNEQRVFKRILLRFDLSLINVHQIGDHLQREKRRAQRQYQAVAAAGDQRQRPVFRRLKGQKRRRCQNDPRCHCRFAPGPLDQHSKPVAQNDHRKESPDQKRAFHRQIIKDHASRKKHNPFDPDRHAIICQQQYCQKRIVCDFGIVHYQ